MSEIFIQRDHTLGMEKARAIAAQWQKESESDWGMDCTYVANETNEQGQVQDRLNFERAGASGYLCVTATQLTMKLELGFLMASFKDKIEEKITSNLEKLLAWNNWGQSNINFQSKGIKAKGGFLMVGYHKSSAPLSLYPLWLEINVDLTPIIVSLRSDTKSDHNVSF